MSWDQYSKGQEVSFRVNGGWKKGMVSETYADSVSVTYELGAAIRTSRIYDQRNIKPWQAKPSGPLTSNEQQSSLF